MRTVNIVNDSDSTYNTVTLFQQSGQQSGQQSQRNLTILKQLQTTLEINTLIEIFATEAAKHIDYSGLSYKFNNINITTGNHTTQSEQLFELKINDKFIGSLSYAIDCPISRADYKTLTELHQLLINPLNNAIRYHEAINLAMHDGLTQLGNRRYFDIQLNRAMAQAMRRNSYTGLILCDLNKFKKINDTFGHTVGDDVLLNFAKALRQSVRGTDSVFRFGGDEFAIIVEDASEGSLNVIERRVHKEMFSNDFLNKYSVSASLGLTFMTKDDTASSFFERADMAMYAKKFNSPTQLSIVSEPMLYQLTPHIN